MTRENLIKMNKTSQANSSNSQNLTFLSCRREETARVLHQQNIRRRRLADVDLQRENLHVLLGENPALSVNLKGMREGERVRERRERVTEEQTKSTKSLLTYNELT